MFGRVGIFALVLGAVAGLVGSSSATDAKTYGGHWCRSADGQEEYYDITFHGVENTDSSGPLEVICPLVEDDVANTGDVVGSGDIEIWYIDHSDVDYLLCTGYVRSALDDGVYEYATVSGAGSADDSTPRQLTFGNIGLPGYCIGGGGGSPNCDWDLFRETSVTYVVCDIPRKDSSGNRSAIQSITFHEPT